MDNIGNMSGESKRHKVMISNRNQGIISGVMDVNEFDSNEISLDTTMGRLIIKGKNLKVKGLNLERGEAEIEGSIDSMVYTAKVSGESVMKRLFR